MSFQSSSSDHNTLAVSTSFWGAGKEKKDFKVKNRGVCEGQVMLQSNKERCGWKKVEWQNIHLS